MCKKICSVCGELKECKFDAETDWPLTSDGYHCRHVREGVRRTICMDCLAKALGIVEHPDKAKCYEGATFTDDYRVSNFVSIESYDNPIAKPCRCSHCGKVKEDHFWMKQLYRQSAYDPQVRLKRPGEFRIYCSIECAAYNAMIKLPHEVFANSIQSYDVVETREN